MTVPQETKAMPFDPDSLEHAPGTVHQSLEGRLAPLDDDAKVRAAVAQAFDYRGDVTLTLADGRVLEGYIFDRGETGKRLEDCRLRLIPKDSDQKLTVRYSEITCLAFSGRDTAAGKSFETWVNKYRQKKAAGEKNIMIEPEKLD
jgi:hypothetical protein